MEELFDFVSTLPEDIQTKVASNKPIGVIRKLERLGIAVPEDILAPIMKTMEENSDYERVMDGMRPFLHSNVYDIPGLIVKI